MGTPPGPKVTSCVAQVHTPATFLIISASLHSRESSFERLTLLSAILAVDTALSWIFGLVTESFPKSTAAIVPSVISVELTEDKTDRFPSPKFSLAVPIVVAPVPPFAIATVPVTFVAEVAVKAFPARFAVMVPAVKLPLASLETIEFGVLELVAVAAIVTNFSRCNSGKFRIRNGAR